MKESKIKGGKAYEERKTLAGSYLSSDVVRFQCNISAWNDTEC